MYIFSIVGIVAVIAVAVLLMNVGEYNSTDDSSLSNDISGQAIKTKRTCGDGICKTPETVINCPADCKPKDTDGDGIYDKLDVCPGYDDNVDTDSDGTPDGCEADTDSDGLIDDNDSDDDNDGYSDVNEAVAGTDPLNDKDPGYPDLIITTAAVTIYDNTSRGESSDHAIIDFSVSNIGLASSAWSYAFGEMTYEDTDGPSQSLSNTVYTPSVTAGSSQSVRLEFSDKFSTTVKDALLAGDSIIVSVTLEADFTSMVSESDETNNIYTTTILLTSADVS